MANPLKIIKNGIINENPTFVQVLGMCPVLAVSTSAVNGVGMGVSTGAVLIGSNVCISAIRKFIPDTVRIPVFIVVIASFVTIIQLILKAFVPALDKSLGLFIPLIVVNCIILARAESFAFKNTIADSFFDGLGMGLGFTIAITMIGSVREIFGNGSIFGIPFLGEDFPKTLIMIMPPGAFLTLGIVMAAIAYIRQNKEANS